MLRCLPLVFLALLLCAASGCRKLAPYGEAPSSDASPDQAGDIQADQPAPPDASRDQPPCDTTTDAAPWLDTLPPPETGPAPDMGPNPDLSQCSPDNCAGCCTSSGACKQGDLFKVCGRGGAPCMNCSAMPALPCSKPTTCVNGTCGYALEPPKTPCTDLSGRQPLSGRCDVNGKCCTTGCIDGNGVCDPGTTPAVCGTAGTDCKACPDETCKAKTCNLGSCSYIPIPGTVCLAGTGRCDAQGICCAGCLDNVNNCYPGTTKGHCGDRGALCQSCGTDACINGSCMPTVPLCTAQNCGGCCSGNICFTLTNQNNNRCGSGGSPCITCSGALVCKNGVCQ